MNNPFKWTRIGYIDGRIRKSESELLTARSILYVRPPFLWFKTRKTVEVGDHDLIKFHDIDSTNHRQYKMQIADWLRGGKIDYISDNGTAKPADIIKLVKD